MPLPRVSHRSAFDAATLPPLRYVYACTTTKWARAANKRRIIACNRCLYWFLDLFPVASFEQPPLVPAFRHWSTLRRLSCYTNTNKDLWNVLTKYGDGLVLHEAAACVSISLKKFRFLAAGLVWNLFNNFLANKKIHWSICERFAWIWALKKFRKEQKHAYF